VGQRGGKSRKGKGRGKKVDLLSPKEQIFGEGINGQGLKILGGCSRYGLEAGVGATKKVGYNAEAELLSRKKKKIGE